MRRLLVGLAIALALLIGALWFYRLDVLTWAVLRSLESAGLGPAEISIDAVGFQVLHARNLMLRGGAIRASELDLAFELAGLTRTHLARAEIAGLALGLVLDERGLTAGGRPLVSASASPGASPFGGLKIDRVDIAGAQIALETPQGAIAAGLSGTLAFAAQGIEVTELSARIALPPAGAGRSINLALHTSTISPQADGGTHATVEGATIAPEGVPWTAQGIDGHLVWQGDQAHFQLAVRQLINQQEPRLVQPLSLAANATLVGSHVDFSGRFEAESAAGTVRAVLDITGEHDLSSSSGSASVVVLPVRFHPGGAQPADLFPIAGDWITTVEGSISVSGLLRWDAGALSPHLVVRLAELGFGAFGAKFSKGGGEITLTKLWPPATPPGQALTATIAAAGLPPSKATLRFQLAAKPALKAEQIEIDIAGGRISMSSFVVDPAAPEVDSVLQIDRMDMAELMALLNIDGLSGTGLLAGHVPVRMRGGTVTINAGKLAAEGSGVLSYKPDKIPQEIGGAGGSVALALAALSDFHYDSLTFELDKSAAGEGTVTVRLSGSNPAVLQGQLFNFNIRIDSNFDRLASYALLGLSSAQELLRRAAREGR